MTPSFDTTSRNPNMLLIEYIRDYLADLGVDSHLTFDDSGKKANLYATCGPQDKPGILLSGHTDCVPVDGQDWKTDPFHVHAQDFISRCLALAFGLGDLRLLEFYTVFVFADAGG